MKKYQNTTASVLLSLLTALSSAFLYVSSATADEKNYCNITEENQKAQVYDQNLTQAVREELRLLNLTGSIKECIDHKMFFTQIDAEEAKKLILKSAKDDIDGLIKDYGLHHSYTKSNTQFILKNRDRYLSKLKSLIVK